MGGFAPFSGWDLADGRMGVRARCAELLLLERGSESGRAVVGRVSGRTLRWLLGARGCIAPSRRRGPADLESALPHRSPGAGYCPHLAAARSRVSGDTTAPAPCPKPP